MPSLVGVDVGLGLDDDESNVVAGTVVDGGADRWIAFGSIDGNSSMMDPVGASLPGVSKTTYARSLSPMAKYLLWRAIRGFIL